jgi:hypothetical protein
MNISIDKKNELITILHYLGQYKTYFPLIATNKTNYTELIDKWFKEYQNHPAVLFSDKLANWGFCFDAPYAFINHLKYEDELQQEYKYPEYVLKRIGGEANANEYLCHINSFIKDTNFSDFWEQAIGTLSIIHSEIQSKFLLVDNESRLFEYYGRKAEAYNVIFSVLSLGGFGVTVSDQDVIKVVNVIGLEGDIDKLPQSEMYFHTMIWHEFGHSIINGLTDKYINDVNRYIHLYDPIKEQMKQRAYPDWYHCVNEHLIRAITNRMVLKYYGDKSYESINNWDRKNGFVYVDRILPILAGYEANRNIYSTIEAFYPLLLKAFEN